VANRAESINRYATVYVDAHKTAMHCSNPCLSLTPLLSNVDFMQAYLTCRLLNNVFHGIVDINNAFLRQGCTLPVPQGQIALTMLLNATPGLSPLHLDFPRLNTKCYASLHRSTRGAVVPWTCSCYGYRDAARSLHDRTEEMDDRPMCNVKL
jgi:hypothetical protein